jgi:hypothetical protein
MKSNLICYFNLLCLIFKSARWYRIRLIDMWLKNVNVCSHNFVMLSNSAKAWNKAVGLNNEAYLLVALAFCRKPPLDFAQMRWDMVVGTETSYGLEVEGLGFPDRLCGPPSLPFGGYLGLKRPGRDVHHSPPSSYGFENLWSSSSTRIIPFHGMDCNNFTSWVLRKINWVIFDRCLQARNIRCVYSTEGCPPICVVSSDLRL